MSRINAASRPSQEDILRQLAEDVNGEFHKIGGGAPLYIGGGAPLYTGLAVQARVNE